jgi:hypothetical protein
MPNRANAHLRSPQTGGRAPRRSSAALATCCEEEPGRDALDRTYERSVTVRKEEYSMFTFAHTSSIFRHNYGGEPT